MRTRSTTPNPPNKIQGSNTCRGINPATQNGLKLKVFVEAVKGIDAVRSNVSLPIPKTIGKTA